MARTTGRGTSSSATTTTAAVVAALGLAAGLAGCGTGGEGDESGTATSDSGPASTITATAAPTSHPAGDGARADLTDDTCEVADGQWGFTGVLTNAGEADATYTVLVSIAQVEGGNVQGSAEIVEAVGPGETTEIAADAIHPDEGPDLHCVISVHRR